MAGIEVSIILVNYNTKQMTMDCIDSIFNYTKDVSFEVIVVDNDSKDASDELFGNDSRILYVKNKYNLGFGRANNIGAEHARGNLLFFLNTDTLVKDNVIGLMCRYMRQHDDTSVCGVNLVNRDMKPTLSFERIYPSIWYLLNELTARVPSTILYGRNAYFNHSKYPLKVAYVSGADLMIRKAAFNEVGGFDNNFFMYYEETDLCYQVKKRGHRIVALPNLQIIHFGGQSFTCATSLPSYEKLKIQNKSMSYYLEKNLTKTESTIFNMLYSLLINLRRVIYTMTGNREKFSMWNNAYKIHHEI